MYSYKLCIEEKNQPRLQDELEFFGITYGQSAPPFCSPIKSGRELWNEWDWATSANTARELGAIFGVLGLSMLVSVLASFVISSYC